MGAVELNGIDPVAGPVGLVHILSHEPGGWVVEDIVRGVPNPFGGVGTGFASNIDLDGETLVCGASSYLTAAPGGGIIVGAVLVYKRTPVGHWGLAQIIEQPPYSGTVPGYGQFGRALALDGGTLVVSDMAGRELVHVFERPANGDWTLVQTIDRPPSSPPPPSYFGRTLALDEQDGVLAVIEGADCQVYERDGSGVWLWVTTLSPLEGTSVAVGTQFGTSAKVRDGMLAIGAPYEAVQGVPRGAVEIFERGSSGWSRTGRLIPPAWSTFTGLGKSVALDDRRVVAGDVGSYGAIGLVPGSVSLQGS